MGWFSWFSWNFQWVCASLWGNSFFVTQLWLGVPKTCVVCIWGSLKESFQFQKPLFFLFICSTTKESWLSGLIKEGLCLALSWGLAVNLAAPIYSCFLKKTPASTVGFLIPSYRGTHPDMKTIFLRVTSQYIMHSWPQRSRTRTYLGSAHAGCCQENVR